MEFTKQDTEQLLQLMKWRRDVRHFKLDPVSQEIVDKLKLAMSLAPSVGNSRPWRVVLVDSQSTRHKIMDNYRRANLEASGLYKDDQLERYLDLKLAGIKEAPLQLAVFTDPDPDEGKGLGRQTMPETLLYSTVAAIHQLWLVARTMNIGVGWVSIIDTKAVHEILNVPEHWILTAYLCVGHPSEPSDEPELQRKGWQDNFDTEWLKR